MAKKLYITGDIGISSWPSLPLNRRTFSSRIVICLSLSCKSIWISDLSRIAFWACRSIWLVLREHSLFCRLSCFRRVSSCRKIYIKKMSHFYRFAKCILINYFKLIMNCICDHKLGYQTYQLNWNSSHKTACCHTIYSAVPCIWHTLPEKTEMHYTTLSWWPYKFYTRNWI